MVLKIHASTDERLKFPPRHPHPQGPHLTFWERLNHLTRAVPPRLLRLITPVASLCVLLTGRKRGGMDCKQHRWRRRGGGEAGGRASCGGRSALLSGMVQISKGETTVRPGARRFSLRGHYDLKCTCIDAFIWWFGGLWRNISPRLSWICPNLY